MFKFRIYKNIILVYNNYELYNTACFVSQEWKDYYMYKVQ